MSEISDLESRISAAMDRIGRGLEALTPAPATEGDDTGEDMAAVVETLQRGLEEEKAANAQIEERMATLKTRQTELETSLQEAEAALAEAKAELGATQMMASVAEEAAAAAREELEAVQEAAAEKAEADRVAQEAAAEDAAAEEAAAKEAAENAVAVPKVDLEQDREVISQFAGRLRRLRRTSRVLRESNQLMREAITDEMPDMGAALVNKSLMAELDDLKAMRAAELVEMDVIVGALRPMLAEGESGTAAETGTEADANSEGDA